MRLLYIFAVVFLVQEVPLKPKEEFEVKMNYEFKQRPLGNSTTINFEDAGGVEKKSGTALLPYLKLNVEVITAAGAVKARVENNKRESLGTKKVKDGTIIPIDVGYTDDVKDRITANEYVVTFMGESKQPISKIIILIEEDGTFSVNGVKRGRL